MEGCTFKPDIKPKKKYAKVQPRYKPDEIESNKQRKIEALRK